jgi:hypothetical protein
MQRILLITATALLLTALAGVGVKVHDKIETSRVQAYAQAHHDTDEPLLVFGVRALEREAATHVRPLSPLAAVSSAPPQPLVPPTGF